MMNTDSKIKSNQKSIIAIGNSWSSTGTLESLIVTNPLHNSTLDRTNAFKSDVQGDAPDALLIEVATPADLDDSLTLIRKLRENNAGLIIVTNINYSAPHAKIECYQAGADHCISVSNDPNKKEQLVSAFLNSPEWSSSVKLTLDSTCLHVCNENLILDLAYQEVKVLDALINAQGHILHHDSIAESMGLNIKLYDSRVLEKSISRLRNKIKTHFGINTIYSVRGYGYRLLRGVMSVK